MNKNCLDVFPEACVIIDTNRKIVQANKKSRKILGIAPNQTPTIDTLYLRTSNRNGNHFALVRNSGILVHTSESRLDAEHTIVALVPLHSFEEPLHRVFNKVSMEGVLILQNDKPVYVDPRLVSITGFSMNELIRGSVTAGVEAFIHPEDQPAALELVTHTNTTNQITIKRKQVRVKTKTGDIKWLEVISNAGLYNGVPTNQLVFIDVTKLKKIEEQLRYQKKMYELVAHASTSGILSVDGKGKILYANPKFASLVGRKMNELINKASWQDFVTEESRIKMGQYARWRRSGEKRAPVTYPFRLIDKFGQERPCIAHAELIEGTDITVASFIDLTEDRLAQSEINALKSKLETAFDQAPIGIILVRQDGILEHVNRATLFLCPHRYTSEQLIDRHYQDLIEENKLLPLFQKLLRTKKSQSFREVPLKYPHNETRYFNFSTVWINKTKLNQGYWLIMIEEVTPQVKVRQMSSNMTQRIIEVQEEEKRRLSQEIHDTLAQSLAVLKMDIQRIIPPEQAATSEGKQILSQIDEIIEATRNIAHSLRPDLLDNLGLVEAIRHYAQEIGNRFHIDVRSYINVDHISFDSHTSLQIFRLIQEALANVVKHSQATQVNVLVFKHGAWFTFVVRDNGIGFNVDTLTDNLQSNHLGMRIMQDRAKDIGADLHLHSVPGEGTTVKIRFRPPSPDEN